jgi:uncharacterized membrane protein
MSTITNAVLSEKVNVSSSTRMLSIAATIWLVVTTIGQWLFGAYIILFYGKHTFSGDFEKWNQVLPHGYVAGDWKGNVVVGSHILLATIMVIGGPLQLITQGRGKFAVFHRWLGRVYVILAIVVSSAGLYMVLSRGGIGDAVQHASISFQAIYIIAFALLTIRFARMRGFEQHRKWALRLFMVVSGVWFFRVELMGWLMLNGGPAGFDPETFTGPFLTFISIFTYGIPLSLIVLEMYFYAQKKQNNTFNILTSAVIFMVTVFMAVGIFAATMGMWLPRL